jgi:hypothetical protein
MLTATTASIWGITVALGVAAAAMVASDGRIHDENRLLRQACMGLSSERPVEDALATIRALSNDGSDSICATLETNTNVRPR